MLCPGEEKVPTAGEKGPPAPGIRAFLTPASGSGILAAVEAGDVPVLLGEGAGKDVGAVATGDEV